MVVVAASDVIDRWSLRWQVTPVVVTWMLHFPLLSKGECPGRETRTVRHCCVEGGTHSLAVRGSHPTTVPDVNDLGDQRFGTVAIR